VTFGSLLTSTADVEEVAKAYVVLLLDANYENEDSFLTFRPIGAIK
jgi:hypothetical protein